ncbi:MAG: hypothetical protein K1X42_07030 [Opitutaceae bacterium]|nr:hypothetical protein [Opitutaceae bacterium]
MRSPRPLPSNKGSTLIAVVIVVVVLSIVLGSVLKFSANTQRNSVRQTRMEKAKLIAESEMEYLFFRWIAEINRGTSSTNIEAEMIADGIVQSRPISTPAAVPFSKDLQSNNWSVARTIEYHKVNPGGDGSAIGLKPGTTERIGRNYYFIARILVRRTDPTFGTIEYRAGRRFVRSETSLLQYAVFYQDDLEIANSQEMIIKGPISTNGSAYVGAQTGSGNNLLITDKLYFVDTVNGATDNTGTTYRKPGAWGTSTLKPPIFDPNLDDGYANDTESLANMTQQARKLAAPENFVGGVNVTKAVSDYPDAYPTANDVYRSVIAPPPVKDGSPLADNEMEPTIESRRMYNRAGIIVTINVDGDGNPVVNVGTKDNPSAFNVDIGPTKMAEIFPEQRKPVFDRREKTNIKMTTMDIAKLKQTLENTPSLTNAFNGVLYIHDNTNDTGLGSGIRLTNGASTPQLNDADGHPKGFAVVSNNGVYIQGNYNTAEISSGVTNPCAIMGDAVTVLSEGWNDDNADKILDERLASMPSDTSPDAVKLMKVNSAILTGNTASTSDPDLPMDKTSRTNSGGVQNLVRMLEDWDYGAVNLEIKGSLVQLFESEYMTGVFRDYDYEGNRTYYQPQTRTLDFDQQLANNPPSWTPSTTEFHRGDLFTW